MTVPVYIAETSPPHLRGRLVTINTLFITAGQFIASIIDGAFSYMQHEGWRYQVFLSIFFMSGPVAEFALNKYFFLVGVKCGTIYVYVYIYIFLFYFLRIRKTMV